MFVPLLLLLKDIDDVDSTLMLLKKQKKKKSSPKKILCEQCKNMFKRERKMANTSSLSALHDEESDDVDDYDYDGNVRRKVTKLNTPHRGASLSSLSSASVIPLKQIMTLSKTDCRRKKSSTESCYICIAKRNAASLASPSLSANITALPIHCIRFRAFLYQNIIDIIKYDRVCSVPSDSIKKLSSSSSSNAFSVLTMKSMLNQIVTIILKQPHSSSMRYCAILIVHHYDNNGINKSNTGFRNSSIHDRRNGYHVYLNQLISIYKKSNIQSATSMSCLQIYCEVVAECAIYDDPQQCWPAIRELIEIALALEEEYRGYQSLEIENDDTEKSKRRLEKDTKREINFVLRCVSHLLVKRHYYLSNNHTNNDNMPKYNECIIKCSDIFHDSSSWIHPSMTIEEQKEIVFVLQKLGILSFLDNVFEHEENEIADEEINKSNHNKFFYWPFFDTVRHASSRMGPKVRCPIIFSNHEGRKANEDKSGCIQKREREDSMSEECILEHLHEDITKHIFSFLGYKKLVRVSGVCKLWNRIANDSFFWKFHYHKRFKVLNLDDLLPDSVDQDIRTTLIEKDQKRLHDMNWRRLFDSKWQKERSLRSKVSPHGWKVRTCDVLSCLTVLPSKTRKEKHYQVHLRNTMKQVDILTRAKKRREEKLLSKKRKSQALEEAKDDHSSSRQRLPKKKEESHHLC